MWLAEAHEAHNSRVCCLLGARSSLIVLYLPPHFLFYCLYDFCMYKFNISCSKNIGLGMHKLCKLWQCNSTFKKKNNVNCIWTIVNCYALATTGRYSVFIFRIPTVFDVIPLELVRFRNTRFSVSSRSFSCPALPFSFSFSYSNVKVENGWRVFQLFPTVFILSYSWWE